MKDPLALNALENGRLRGVEQDSDYFHSFFSVFLHFFGIA